MRLKEVVQLSIIRAIKMEIFIPIHHIENSKAMKT